LAYRKKSPVNFCPKDKTVLSDEQVIEGKCERCGSVVEKRDMEQWFFRITKYAERLLQNTYKPTFAWPEKVKIGQRNWIGKKEGINITYEIDSTKEKVTVFTTAPVNFGMTFLVLSPEHQLTKKIISGEVKLPDSSRSQVEEYVKTAKKKSEMERIAEGKEKTGVFTGLYAINAMNEKKVPVWVTDFVLGHVGTGAVQGCPGHDLKDFQFAKKFGLPIIRVIKGTDGDISPIGREEQVIEKGMKGTFVNSEFLNGLDFEEGLQKTMDHFVKMGVGKRIIEYKLRDWCISRQRYWGAPIPMIHCKKCAWQTVPENDLPVLLPDLKDWKPEGTGKGPLAKLKDWVKVSCPQCGGVADRETDVCDTFLDSSWYFLRYPSIGNQKSKIKNQNYNSKLKINNVQATNYKLQFPWDPQITKKWLPVTQYIGGAEHTVLHLLYARFVTMAFKDWGLLDFEEPFSRFYAHGLIIAEGAKMSKSKGNVVVPDQYIKAYGADTLRVYLMFLGPFDGGGDFRDSGIAGMYRFLARVWRLCQEHFDKLSAKDEKSSLNKIMHKTIKGVTEDLEGFRYNRAIAKIMEYVNEMSKINPPADRQKSKVFEENIETLILLLAPFAPYMCEELWQIFKIKNQKSKIKSDMEIFESIHLQPWPRFDPKYLVEDMISFVIQVNGKVRDVIKIKNPFGKAQGKQKSKIKSDVESLARASEKVKKYVEGKKIRKVVFVPGRLINFVLF